MDDKLYEQVRGVNPAHGAPHGFFEAVADDEALAHLALALRALPVGSFQELNGDLRTPEASALAAKVLMEKLLAVGYELSTVPVERPVVEDGSPVEARDARRHEENVTTTAKASTDAKSK